MTAHELAELDRLLTKSSAQKDYEAGLIKAWGGNEAQYLTVARAEGCADEQIAAFKRAGVVLQPVQLQFAAAARRADQTDVADEILMGGARGGSKSFATFAQLALDDCQRFEGMKALYLRRTGKAAKEQLEDLFRAVLRHTAADYNRERVVFPNGSRILIGGFKDDNEALKYQGLEYDMILIEELTQLSERTYKTLRLSVRTSKAIRPRSYNTTNPMGIGHAWVKRRFIDPHRRGEQGDTVFIPATVDDNVFVNREYVGNLDDLTGAEYRAYRLGDWDVSAGAYFDVWNYNQHVIPAIDDLSWMREVWCSMDYGFNHWNIILLHARDGDGNVYTVDELAHRKRQPQEIAPDITAWLSRYGLTRRDLSMFLVGSDVFNRTGASQYTLAEQYQRLGYFLSHAETSPGSRISGAHHLAKLMGDPDRGIPPTWFVTKRCPKLIDTLPYLERDPHNAEDVLKVDADEQGVGGDDPYDCLRYGLFRPHISTIA